MRIRKNKKMGSQLRQKPEVKSHDYFKYIGLLAFMLSVSTFYCNEKWKRAEFFDKKYKDFLLDEDTRMTRKFLFYSRSFVKVNGADISLWGLQKNKILETPEGPEVNIEMNDTIISDMRDRLHNYFDNLNTFYIYYEEGNVTKRQLRSYLTYDLKAIADTSYENTAITTKYYVWLFINRYGYNGISKLCKLCGLPEIPSDAETHQRLEQAIEKEYPE